MKYKRKAYLVKPSNSQCIATLMGTTYEKLHVLKGNPPTRSIEKVWILSQLAKTLSPPVGLGHPELNDNSSGHFDFLGYF